MIHVRNVASTIIIIAAFVTTVPQRAQNPPSAKPSDPAVKAEHDTIGNEAPKAAEPIHTMHPEAQWYPDAGLGLFLHWGISSVKGMNISWPMIPGRALAQKKLTPEERERVIRESDYNLDGKPLGITPNEYWTMAASFNPTKYDPDKWLKAAKAAGFTYVVLTTRHHEGFALWPSAYGNFSTKNFMGGRDLLKAYVEAGRRNGLKVGFYYSPPDWYFDREYMNFLYGGGARNNPELPPLGPDLKPRTSQKSEEERAKHQAAYAAMVKGQVEELLTRYGRIDLLWFDGRPNIPNGNQVITAERIRELQPWIVINPRLHGKGDFVTYERRLTTEAIATGWAEFCNTWTNSWPHVNGARFRSNGFILGQFVKARSLGINYLLGVGPMSSGEFTPEIYQNMSVVADWMKLNGEAVRGTKPLPSAESASVPATASGSKRFLFLLPQFKQDGVYDEDMLPATDSKVILETSQKPTSVKLLSDGSNLEFRYVDNKLEVHVPATKRSKLVDVIEVTITSTQQSQTDDRLTGNWAVRNVNDTDGVTRSTYFNLKSEGGKITGTIRATQFFYTIKESTGGPDGFTIIATMPDGRTERRVQYEGKLVGDELHIGRRNRPDQPITEMVAKRAPAGEGAMPARIEPPARHKVAYNGLAKTPPMGWNSWNKFAGRIDDATVRGIADAMASNGMKEAGYIYVNIDDTWEAGRDANGEIQTNKKFPDMKALADYVHKKGLKLGIYSSPGPNTCAGYEGSYGHEEQDAMTFAKWGIDYLKYDWCGARILYTDEEMPAIYQKMGDALLKTGRKIVYSLCQYGRLDVWKWGPEVGGNLWRTTGDIRDTWDSMSGIGFRQNELAQYARPGHWNDPDMLEIGNGAMSDTEYKTHMSLWAMLAAPLLAGNDLRSMTPETLAILTNREVIAVDQDKLGKQGSRFSKSGDQEIWTRQLAGGSLAVAFFNRAKEEAKMSLKWTDVGAPAKRKARDLWKHQDVDVNDPDYSVSVPGHGVVMLRIVKKSF